MYELPNIDGSSLGPGTNLLVSGSAMSGKQRFGLETLTTGSQGGDGAIVVSTKDTGPRILDRYAEIGDAESPVGVIDCVTQQQGTEPTGDDRILYAASPVDMTGIGINFSKLLESFYSDHGRRRNRILFSSLSTLLMYSDLQTVFRFLHVFTGRIQSANALGLYCLDSAAHDAQTMNTLKQLFDGQLTLSAEKPPSLQLSGIERPD